jgi:ribonuclease R/exosome complex exonuclease DIS3/RRP44
VDNNGNPTGFYVKKQKKANFLIEELMLLANVSVAEKIIESKRKGVFRIHDKPDEKKIAEIDSFIKKLGYRINISNSKDPNKTINKLLELIEKTPEKNIIDMMVIRAMSKAKYSSKNIGHFGLMFENYTHFTSPIRRYPDLIVHRIIDDIINKRNVNINDIESLCLHCSTMEEKATKAERASIKLMQVKYMSDKVGESFDGVVSGISERGLFVEIKKNKCEGFVRMKDIPNDFFNLNRKTNTIIGQNTYQEYSLGDNVRVSVLKTNLEKKHIDLNILD